MFQFSRYIVLKWCRQLINFRVTSLQYLSLFLCETIFWSLCVITCTSLPKESTSFLETNEQKPAWMIVCSSPKNVWSSYLYLFKVSKSGYHESFKYTALLFKWGLTLRSFLKNQNNNQLVPGVACQDNEVESDFCFRLDIFANHSTGWSN